MSAWEQYPDESSEAFTAFCIYRDMGPSRSIDKVALALNPEREHEGGRRAAYGRLFVWSSRYRWVSRARGYDLEQVRIEKEVWESERRELARKRLHVSHLMLDMVTERLNGIQPDDIPVNQLPRWAESAAKVSVVIDENPYDALLDEIKTTGGGQNNIDLIISDPKARKLALELDERLWELENTQTSSQESTDDQHVSTQSTQ
jgi:hypothetical protein